MDIPVYISMTSMFRRQGRLFECLKNILKQSYKPTKIFIYLSEDASFFDDGFKDKKITNESLLTLISENEIYEVIWGKDIGSYGKLLPLLKRKWEEDCLIITFDDDTVYDYDLIKNLVSDYKKNKCLINYRGRKMHVESIKELQTFDYLKGEKRDNYKNLFNFPTGKGGILYHPSFFHGTKDLVFNEDIYGSICKTNDDVWFYLVRIANNVDCYIDNKAWLKQDNHDPVGLWSINGENNCQKNNIQVISVTKKFIELGYL